MEDNLDRRQFISRSGSFLALTATGSGAWASSDSSDLFDLYIGFSRRLTGHDDLEIDVAEKLFGSFLLKYERQELSELLLNADGNSDFQRALLAAWYGGVSPDGNSDSVLIFEDALVWKALRYTKPWAVCGGEFGDWAENPIPGSESGENET